MNLKIISAGAGSGKTYRLTSEMVELLKGEVRASGIIANQSQEIDLPHRPGPVSELVFG